MATTEETNNSSGVEEIEKIGKLIVKKVPTLEEVSVSSFWQDQTVVITFFRRFGCIFCRQAAKEISALAPILAKHDVKLVGIGIDEVGMEEFFKANFFEGDLYIDPTKETYKALGFKRFGVLNGLVSFFSKSSREAYSKSKADKMTGNLKGDPWQNGGVIIVKKGGTETLFSYKAENAADHVNNEDVLKALGINEPIPETNAATNGTTNGTNGVKESNGEAEAVAQS